MDMEKGKIDFKYKRLCAWLAVLTFLSVIIYVVTFMNPNSKSNVKKYIRNHQTELTQYAELMIEENMTLPTTYNGWDVSYFSSGNMVQFTVSAFGIVPSGVYKGFYFSPEDKPLGFQGVKVELTPVGEAWNWTDDHGGDSQYTEKITDKWYWFEATF